MCTTLVLASSVPATHAQVLEEIVVTAQKREQSIQDVGIAITAFTGEQLKTFGFINNTEVAAFTPGVHLSGTDKVPVFTIRGATQSDFGDLPETPTAVYVDEAYQASGQAQVFSTFDMERVEILKGPQGTLFGRNATGGLVHFITKKPTKTFEAYGDLSYGSYDSVRFEGAVGGPLSQTVSVRIAGFHYTHDPVLDNVFTPADLPPTPGLLAAQGRGPLTSNPADSDDIWNDDRLAVRGQLLFEPTPDVTVLLKGNYAETDQSASAYFPVPSVAIVDDTDNDGVEDQIVDTARVGEILSAAAPCEDISVNTGGCVNSVFDLDFDGLRPNARGDYFGAFVADGIDDLDINTDFAPSDSDKTENYGFTGKLTWDLGIAQLIAVSNYSSHTKRQALDVDAGPTPQTITNLQSDFEWFSQEVRLTGESHKIRWIGGFYYLHIDGKYAQGLADSIGGIHVFGGLFFNGFLSTANDFLEATVNADLETNSYSLFGQIDYDLTDQLTLNLGFRGIIEEKDYTYTSRLYTNTRDARTDGALFGGASPLTLPGTSIPFEFLPPFSDDTSDFLWSGKAQINWQPRDDLLLYAGVNRGVKAGSFNAPLLTALSPDQYGYDEEVLLAYEAGFKSTLFAGKMRLNASAYYYDYKDYQGFQFVGVSGAIFNVDAEHKGFEIELFATPVEQLEMLFSVSYIDAEIEDLLVAPNTPRDVEPAFTPEVQFNALGRYTWPNVFLGGSVILQVDGNHASSAFFNINNFGADQMDSYWVGNARVSWVGPDERWEIGAFVNNFSDTRNQTTGFATSSFCGCDTAAFGRPRWWGARIRYTWQ